MKKLVAFCHNLERNGSNNFLKVLCESLLNEFDISLSSTSNGPLADEYKQLGICVQIHDVLDPNHQHKIATFVQQCDFAIINTMIRCDGVIACDKHNIEHIWVIHEAWPLTNLEKEISAWGWKWPKAEHVKVAAQCARKIIFPAQLTAERFSPNIETERIHVIYNGVEVPNIDKAIAENIRHDVRQQLGFDKDEIVVFHPGTVNHRKNQHVTAKTVHEINKTADRKLSLLFVGARRIRDYETTYLEQLETILSQADDFTAQHSIIVDVQKSLAPYFLAADIVTCPSLSEVLPYVILEAMQAHKPVIASNIDGIPEMIRHGHDGFLINDFNDEFSSEMMHYLTTLVAEHDLRQTITDNAKNTLTEKFNKTQMLLAYRSLICS